MPAPVTADQLIQARADDLRTLLNSGHHLRLFSNNLALTPDTALADFTEATYGGYAPVDLAGQFSAISKVQPGEWQFSAGPYSFARTGAPTGNVWGWYVADATHWRLAQKFASFIEMTLSSSFELVIKPQGWSLSLLQP